MSAILFAWPGNEAFGRRVAVAGRFARGALELHRFPDGESRVRLVTPVRGRDVILLCTLHDPDAKVLPLLFAAATARELGARRVLLAAPYLAYLRQDRRFHPGEAVSARLFGAQLSLVFDGLVTVDPHLHRVHRLGDVFDGAYRVLSAAPAVADWIRGRVRGPLVIGPDAESAQWAADVAQRIPAPCLVLRKRRRSDRRVLITLPDTRAFRDRTPVLVDDIASTGRTLAHAVRQLRRRGFARPACVVTHAVFAGDAAAVLRRAGAVVASSDTIAHRTNRIGVAMLVAAGLNELLAEKRR